MKINTQNYEAYLLDFIEGNLSPVDEIELRKFVRLHPYLQIDLENLNDFKLVPEKTHFNSKNLLKENPEKAINGISKIERLSIAFLENEIMPEELNELNQLFENNKYKKVFNDIQKTKIAGSKIIYKNKSALKQKIQTEVFKFKISFLYRAAALVLLLLSVTFWFYKDNKLIINNVSLLDIKKIPLREISVYEEDNLKLTELISETNYTEKQIITSIKPLDKKRLEELDFIQSKPVELMLAENQKLNFKFVKKQQPEVFNDVNRKKEKEDITKKAVWTVKKTGKTVLYNIVFSLRKNIRYRKQYLDNGKVLIALKAGEFEYKKIKDVKKP